jgi:Fur family ferric uptake transcriptional regulator/Fur family zinc uptake transcriptional regulator
MHSVPAEELLHAAGVRVTSIRCTVLECLLRVRSPLTHGELSGLDELGSLDRVSLYRTLHLLRRTRLVHAVQGVDGTWRYCAQAPRSGSCPGDHPHFLCEACGRMWCLSSQRLPQVEVPPELAVRGKQLVVYGLCGECRR